MTIAIDFETTGLSLYHSDRPFAAVWSDGNERQCRQWPVDPKTRRVQVRPEDVIELWAVVNRADRIVMHNAKFDCTALATLGIEPPWEKIEDTVVASHVLYSAPPHNLTVLADRHLDVDIKPFEDRVEAAVKKCRNMVVQDRLRRDRALRKGEKVPVTIADWYTAEEGDPDLPGVKGKESWRSDYWLPAAMARHDRDSPPEWATVLQEYALIDAVVTVHLWDKLSKKLREKGLWEVYRAKLAVLPVLYRAERRGMNLRTEAVEAATEKYRAEAEESSAVIAGIARSMNYALELPKGNTNYSLDDFLFGRAPRPDGKRNAKLPRTHAPDTLNLPVLGTTESGAPAFDSDVRTALLGQLEKGTKARLFVSAFGRRADAEKALQALDGYRRFSTEVDDVRSDVLLADSDGDCSVGGVPGLNADAVPTGRPGRGGGCSSVAGEGDRLTRWLIHPSFHATGTQTTRLSSSNPNAQCVATSGSGAGLRECFGPAPGRVWYSMDAANIELRIPAYLAGERELIEVFEHPEDGPYYGSYHLLVFDTVHPAIFAAHGKSVKADDSPYFGHYKRVKNGNFARQYGAQEALVDATFGVAGAYKKIAARFPRIDKLNRDTVALANRTGRVYTVPDREVDPNRGYPIVCRRTARDTISPTVPFAYFVSGTAGWWMNRALVKADALLEGWRRTEGYDGHVVATVHDEIVYDLPGGPDEAESNRPYVTALRRAMESCGDAIGVPTPVTVDRHVESWASGEAVK